MGYSIEKGGESFGWVVYNFDERARIGQVGSDVGQVCNLPESPPYIAGKQGLLRQLTNLLGNLWQVTNLPHILNP
jgi:hypothetical protein